MVGVGWGMSIELPGVFQYMLSAGVAAGGSAIGFRAWQWLRLKLLLFLPVTGAPHACSAAGSPAALWQGGCGGGWVHQCREVLAGERPQQGRRGGGRQASQGVNE